MNVFSLDYDFWVPEDPMMDLGHAERGLYMELLWQIRLGSMADIQSRLRLDETEQPHPMGLGNFLKQRGFDVGISNDDDSNLSVAESHASIIPALETAGDKLRIVSVDAHHDMGYHTNHQEEFPNDCGTWLKDLIEADRVEHVQLIYPTWRSRDPYQVDWHPQMDDRVAAWKKQHGTEIEVTYGLDSMPEDFIADEVFFCRSGAWVPPWVDTEFLDMVKLFMVSFSLNGYVAYTYRDLDGFERTLDYEAAEEQLKQTQAMMQEVTQR